MVDVKSERLLAITSLVIGIIFLILAIYSLGSVPHTYTLTFVELILGLIFVVLALGTFLPMYAKKPENRKSVTLSFTSLFLIIAGFNLLIFTPALMIVFQFNWWIFTLIGAVLLIIGIFLLYKYWTYRASLNG